MGLFDTANIAITCGRAMARVDYDRGVRVYDELNTVIDATQFQTIFTEIKNGDSGDGHVDGGNRIHLKHNKNDIDVYFYVGEDTEVNYMKIKLDWSFADGSIWVPRFQESSIDGADVMIESGDSDSATYWCFKS